MAIHYKELTVWQKAVDLVEDVYRLTTGFPEEEKFGLVAQLRRAAVSIPSSQHAGACLPRERKGRRFLISNIAEGQGRLTVGEFKQFLGHARGSLFEVETQLLITKRLEWIAERDFRKLHDQINEVGRLLNGLIRSLNARSHRPPPTND